MLFTGINCNDHKCFQCRRFEDVTAGRLHQAIAVDDNRLIYRDGNVNDAVYISRTTPLTKTLNDTARYVGTNLTWTAQWRVASNITVFGEYVHEIAGRAITLAGGHGADVGVVQIDFNF